MVNTQAQEQAQEQAQALALLAKNEGNIAKTSRSLGITPYMLRKLRDANRELYEAARRRIFDEISDKTLIIAEKYASEIIRRVEDKGELKEMKIRDLAVVLGITIDKINVIATAKGKYDAVERAAQELGDLTEEELIEVIDAEYKEIKDSEEAKTDEDMSDTPKDELPAESSGVSAIRSVLHRRSDTQEP